MKKRLGDLIIDELLTRLRPINGYFVSVYRQAYRSGKDLGEIVIEKGTNRIVSGNHRVTALLAEYGEDHIIEVEEKYFNDEAELLEYFAEANVKNGNPLIGVQRRAITQELLKHNVEREKIANIFGVSIRKVEEWAGITVLVIGKKQKKMYKPVKRGVEPGIEMTEQQYEEHMKADRGVSAVAQTKQLMRWIENGWITDHESILYLHQLADLVNATFVEEVTA